MRPAHLKAKVEQAVNAIQPDQLQARRQKHCLRFEFDIADCVRGSQCPQEVTCKHMTICLQLLLRTSPPPPPPPSPTTTLRRHMHVHWCCAIPNDPAGSHLQGGEVFAAGGGHTEGRGIVAAVAVPPSCPQPTEGVPHLPLPFLGRHPVLLHRPRCKKPHRPRQEMQLVCTFRLHTTSAGFMLYFTRHSFALANFVLPLYCFHQLMQQLQHRSL